jgi:hypothetical protein
MIKSRGAIHLVTEEIVEDNEIYDKIDPKCSILIAKD